MFWTSPRSAWTPQTLAAAADDRQRDLHDGSISGTHVVVTGPTDTSIGVSMAKDYSADATSGWINDRLHDQRDQGA